MKKVLNVTLNIIKWGISILMLILSLAFFTTEGGFLSGILILLICAISNPIFASILRKKNIRIKKVILIPTAIVFF